MRRVSSFIACCCALAAAAIITARGMFALGYALYPGPVPVQFSLVDAMSRALGVIAAHSRNPLTCTVAFVGDSTVVAYPLGQTVDARLQEKLSQDWVGPGRLHVESLSAFGLTPPAYFLLQDTISVAEPDIVIVTVNLSSIRDPIPEAVKVPELAGWVAASRFYETLAGLDLFKFGVTADRLLLYKMFVLADGSGTWLEQSTSQARLGHLREAVESAVAVKTGWIGDVEAQRARKTHRAKRAFQPGESVRPTRARSQESIGEVMAGVDEEHWVVETLRATLAEFASRGIATILYVPPTNLDHWRTVGVYDEAGLARSIASLERIAYETGAEFADLHDLLPDAAFRDAGGHFTHAPPYDGPALVADALAPYVAIQARTVAHSR
jgi:hypothetical protein